MRTADRVDLAKRRVMELYSTLDVLERERMAAGHRLCEGNNGGNLKNLFFYVKKF